MENSQKQQNNLIDSREDFTKKIEEMFEHKSKLSSLVDKEVITNYKDTYYYLSNKVSRGELPSHNDYFGGNVLAETIYTNKYFLRDLNGVKIEQRAEDVFVRLASFIACVENSEEKRNEYAQRFYRDLYEGYYLPGGRVIAGSGDLYRLKTLANCFVSLIKGDNLESIYKSSYEAARTYSYGGGIGIDISQLRPKGAKVHNAADNSTGAVSFMDLYSLTTGLIGQSGRRGALMLTIDIKHPDVLDFIKVKKEPNWVSQQIMERLHSSGMFSQEQLDEAEKNIVENTQIRFANISIKVSDEFMSAVEEQKNYGKDKILVYAKPKGGAVEGPSSDEENYSYGISIDSKNDYSLLHSFNSIEELNGFLKNQQIEPLKEDELNDVENRDFYGDYVISDSNLETDLAIKYSGDYLTYYKSSTIGEIKQLYKARDIWNKFVEGNYKTAEPGLIFWSQMSKYSPSNYVGRPISCTNPCGEVPLEDGGACNLGSVNLSRMVDNGFTSQASINWDLLTQTIQHLTRFLDNVVWWNETLNALESQRDAAHSTRRLGIGVMGIADMFLQLGYQYDSSEALDLLEKVMDHIAQVSYQTSALLAKEKGSAPAFELNGYRQNPFFKEVLTQETQSYVEEYGIRNIAILSIAPTGTISNAICGYKIGNKNYLGISGGIEPIFALYYQRRSEQMDQGGVYNVFHNIVQAYIDQKGLSDDAKDANEEGLKEILPSHFFRTAHYIEPEMRINIQGIAQKYVDHSISSTINLAEDINPEVISNIYLKAWKNNLKGVTIYRDGSRFPILSTQKEETLFQRYKDKQFTIKEEGENKTVAGDEILSTPDGKLTTLYHLQNT